MTLFYIHIKSTNPSLESAQSMEYWVSKVPGFPPDSAVSTPWLWTQFNPTVLSDLIQKKKENYCR